MILDSLDNAYKYADLHPLFCKAFDFLRDEKLADLSAGKHEIEGDTLFASVSKSLGRNKKDADIEVHRDYIDIQYVVSGCDEMGWSPLQSCTDPEAEYDIEKDIQFFKDAPQTWIKVTEGSFAIFFPEDAHLPLISDEIIHKVVMKIKV